MSGDRQHRHAVAVAVEQAVDQMQVARPAGAGADRQLAADVRFRAGGEGGDLFVTRRHPLNGAHAVQAVAQPVQGISGHPPDTFDAGVFQRFRDQRRNGLFHHTLLWL